MPLHYLRHSNSLLNSFPWPNRPQMTQTLATPQISPLNGSPLAPAILIFFQTSPKCFNIRVLHTTYSLCWECSFPRLDMRGSTYHSGFTLNVSYLERLPLK